ncbi:MAG: winged helix-turn-helix domain-containing protein [Bacteroidales bacterium]|nr:winged helix-turn-helix domain-containing protein [Bacteroidales bacterium]
MKYPFEIISWIIMQLLLHHKALSIEQISEHTKYSEPIIILALGILLHEGKIELFEKDDDLYIELKEKAN